MTRVKVNFSPWERVNSVGQASGDSGMPAMDASIMLIVTATVLVLVKVCLAAMVFVQVAEMLCGVQQDVPTSAVWQTKYESNDLRPRWRGWKDVACGHKCAQQSVFGDWRCFVLFSE